MASETDIRTKYITPAIQSAGWNKHYSFEEEYTAGRIKIIGKKSTREKPKRIDYILYYKPHLPLAIIEAKKDTYSISSGMQQALNYADILLECKNLDIPFVYSSNGKGFLEHDRTTGKEREIAIDDFPTPQELWQRYKEYKNIDTQMKENVAIVPYYTDDPDKKPRYYQRIAINKTIEAIVNDNKKRVLLVMATGTGKTYTAFQIIHKLYKTKVAQRILFLADRNILVDQTKINDFAPFGSKMTKITNRTVDTAYEIYLGIYQALTGDDEKNIYKEFSKDFFDLIVIDEAHRGSAREDSQWREILDYFSSAIHIGLTATPKETKEVSNIDYFGKSIYTYSLKQGIEDGFLAPYKVVRYTFDKDVDGYRPYDGERDKYGNIIDDREYNIKDYDKNLILENRTKLVAKCITKYLKNTDRMSKTIVFCVDTLHAERMRSALVNENSDLVQQYPKYVVRITGNDEIGKQEIDNFMHPEKMPIIATTSKLLSTGVDTKTVKVIALDSNIESMIEFKQIIGRGTRVKEEFGKSFFSILDFRSSTKHFADKEFDDEPQMIKEIKLSEDDTINTNDVYEDIDNSNTDSTQDDKNPQMKYYVDSIEVNIYNEIVQYLDENGKLQVRSLKDYTKANIIKKFASLDDFLTKWSSYDKKSTIIEELENEGIIFEELSKIVGKEFDPFDMILHIAYDKPPLTRSQRAKNVQTKDYFTQYEESAKIVLDRLLQKYQDNGIKDIESMQVLSLFDDIGTPMEIISLFGTKTKYNQAIKELENILYEVA